jgi:DNA polymerase-3 subunit gamma/tau
VDAAEVRAMLGLADRARIVDLFEQVMRGDVAAALAEFRSQYDTGADPATVLTDLAEFNHLVTRLRFVPEAVDDASLSQDERSRGAALAGTLSVRVLSRTWQMLLKGIPEVQNSSRPVSAAEMVLIRLVHAADLPTLDEALKALESEAGSPNGGPRQSGASSTPSPSAAPSANGGGASAVAQTRMPASGGGAQAMRLVEAAPAPEPVAPVIAPEPAAEVAPSVQVKSLADLVALAEAHRDQLLKVNLKAHVRLLKASPGRLDVGLTDAAPKTLLGDLKSKIEAWTGQRWMVSLSKDEGGQTLAEMEAAKRETAFLDARSDPAVAAVLARFPGAKIIDVRIPDAQGDPDAPDANGIEADLPVEPAADDDD